jgi:hypothetical protein
MQLFQIVESRLVIIIESYFHVVMGSNIFFLLLRTLDHGLCNLCTKHQNMSCVVGCKTMQGTNHQSYEVQWGNRNIMPPPWPSSSSSSYYHHCKKKIYKEKKKEL